KRERFAAPDQSWKLLRRRLERASGDERSPGGYLFLLLLAATLRWRERFGVGDRRNSGCAMPDENSNRIPRERSRRQRAHGQGEEDPCANAAEPHPPVVSKKGPPETRAEASLA